jgi:hypothetical protein
VTSAAGVAEQTAIPRSAGLLKKVFCFPVMISGLLLVLALLTVRSRFDDPDMWWHLKTGEIIWTTHTIPINDIFSYTTNHHAYVAHEWLAQVLIYGAYRFGGYPGLMLWLWLFTSAVLIAGYVLCSFYSGNAKVAFLGALTIWLFATIGLAIRPQMVGYLLLIIELLLLHLGRTRNPRWFLGLPPLFALWINCHGSFFLGLIVAGTLLFSSLFEFQIGSLVSPHWTPQRRQMLTFVFVLSVAALFLNPIGAKQIFYPMETLLHLPVSLSQVQEWQPLQLGDGRGLALLGVLGAIFLLVIVRRSELLWHELLLLALGTWLAAGHRRMLFPFGILAAPILSRLLSTSWEDYDPEQDRPWPNMLFLAASLLIVFWVFPSRQNLTEQVDQISPVKAVDFIKARQLPGRMLNEYVYGGYLIWAAPEHPVFVDGRGDVFEETGVLGEFGNWATLQSVPDALLDKYRIDFCLLTRNSPMATVFPLMPHWKAIYSDDQSIIFARVPATSSLK